MTTRRGRPLACRILDALRGVEAPGLTAHQIHARTGSTLGAVKTALQYGVCFGAVTSPQRGHYTLSEGPHPHERPRRSDDPAPPSLQRPAC